MKKTILSLLVALMATTGANAQTGDVTMTGDWNTTNSQYEFSGSFLMPAYNVEVSTELWYKVDEEKTLAENIAAYGTKSDFFLNRTLTANVWNTFASPFAIAAGDMEKYFGEGAKVRQLNTTSVDGTVLTLNFTDANKIVAGQPYLVKPTLKVVKLQHRQQILAGSYAGIQTKNSSDDDDPDYDGNSWGNIWDAN